MIRMKFLLFIFFVSCATKKAEPPAAVIEKPKPVAKEVQRGHFTGRLVKEPKDFKGEILRKNCQFGKVTVKDDTEIPNANFAPSTLCEVNHHKYQTNFVPGWIHYEWVQVAFIPQKPSAFIGVLDYGVEGGMET